MSGKGIVRDRTPLPSPPPEGAVIWTIVSDGAFVRSARGGKGRPYRGASANLEVTLRVGDQHVPETDARTIERVSGAIREKYGASFPGPAAALVREEVLATTPRLPPA
ncbi:MAG: hypothetical protein M3P49_07565 [Actinomycetota bacterium]|nr:hypothetical protein [Actinomycetota bacterium]